MRELSEDEVELLLEPCSTIRLTCTPHTETTGGIRSSLSDCSASRRGKRSRTGRLRKSGPEESRHFIGSHSAALCGTNGRSNQQVTSGLLAMPRVATGAGLAHCSPAMGVGNHDVRFRSRASAGSIVQNGQKQAGHNYTDDALSCRHGVHYYHDSGLFGPVPSKGWRGRASSPTAVDGVSQDSKRPAV
jgi:hypothetical protein